RRAPSAPGAGAASARVRAMSDDLPAARLAAHLAYIYDERGASVLPRLLERIAAVRRDHPELVEREPAESTQDDVVLITYADQVRTADAAPLPPRHGFTAAHPAAAVNPMHLLPFIASTPDERFSLVVYTAVYPELSDWSDVKSFGRDFALMFDA